MLVPGTLAPTRRRKQRRLSIDDFRQLARERGGCCLSPTYRNSKQKLRWKCAKGHVWKSGAGNVMYSGGWCPRYTRATGNSFSRLRRIIAEDDPEPDSRMEIDRLSARSAALAEERGRPDPACWLALRERTGRDSVLKEWSPFFTEERRHPLPPSFRSGMIAVCRSQGCAYVLGETAHESVLIGFRATDGLLEQSFAISLPRGASRFATDEKARYAALVDLASSRVTLLGREAPVWATSTRIA